MAERQKRKEQTSALVKTDGALSLTFVNTAAERRRSPGDYDDLLAWALEHRSLSSVEAARLRRLAAERPEDAAAAFGAAEELRALLSRIFNAAAEGQEPPREAVDSLSAFLIQAVPPRRLVFSNGRYRLAWVAGREDDLSRPLWEVAVSAQSAPAQRTRRPHVQGANPSEGQGPSSQEAKQDLGSLTSHLSPRSERGFVDLWRRSRRELGSSVVLKKASRQKSGLFVVLWCTSRQKIGTFVVLQRSRRQRF